MVLTIKAEAVLPLLERLNSTAAMTPELFSSLKNGLNNTYQIYQSACQKLQIVLDTLNQQEVCERNTLAEIRNQQEYIMQKINDTSSQQIKEALTESYYQYEMAAEECIKRIDDIEEKKQINITKVEELKHYSHCFEDGQSFLNKLQNDSSEFADGILSLSKSIERLVNQLLSNN